MKPVWILPLVLLLPMGCAEETRGPAPERPLDITAGTVFDSRSERPLSAVEVYTDELLVTTTDSTGHYEAAAGFHPVAEWWIGFVKDGYKPRSFDMPESGERDPDDPTRFRLDVAMERLP
ncbi:MAG: hypothetical protein GF346_00870 [Candidatus Eisenbacteria bacterium]|nr:hypothetical protein [Candidatus Latescibacterota bacterium]MBD3300984.1 hypothetical protein [Candidatus Eisenbacteria bacterium]